MLCSKSTPSVGVSSISPTVPVNSKNPNPYVVNRPISHPPLLQRPRRRRPIGTRPRTGPCFVPQPPMLPPRRIHRHGNRPRRRRRTILPIPHRSTRPIRPHTIIPHPDHHRRPHRRLIIPLPHLATRQDGEHKVHQPVIPISTGKSFGGEGKDIQHPSRKRHQHDPNPIQRRVRRPLAVHVDVLPPLALRDPEAHVAQRGDAREAQHDVDGDVGAGVDAAAVAAGALRDELEELPGEGCGGLRGVLVGGGAKGFWGWKRGCKHDKKGKLAVNPTNANET